MPMGRAKRIDMYWSYFSPYSDGSPGLRVAQMPRYPQSGDFRAIDDNDNNGHTNGSLYPLRMRMG